MTPRAHPPAAPRPGRRTFLASLAAATASLAGCPTGDSETPGTGGDEASTGGDGSSGGTTGTGGTGDEFEFGAESVATGIGSPTDVVALESGDLLVAEQPGRVTHVDAGEVRTLLDLQDRVVDVSGYSEQGLLGVEPHPDFADNGRLFVRYSAPPREGTPDGYSHIFVLAEFTVDPDAMTADPDGEQSILEIPEPQPNHNAGHIAFGPDGFLYVPVGDGGGANDQGPGHVEDWYDPVPGGNGQDTTENLLGSMLRVDVDDQAGDRPYGIPADNPLVGSEGRDEHYAWGLRNPWGISFGPDGRLFVADVGQNRYEEIDVVERGGNYGWNVREGLSCFQAAECPNVTPSGERLVDPIVSYPRDGAPVSGVAVVGGHLYDGSALTDLQGRYVFGDWQFGGQLFVAREVEEGTWPTETAPVVSGDPGESLLSIGRDADGELLLGTTNTGGVTDDGGMLHRLTSA